MSYVLKERLAAAGNYGGRRDAADIRYLVLHYTGNDGDTDEGNGAYFAGNTVKSSAHYFVDDDSVTRSVPDLRIAWSVGGKKYASCAETGGGTMYGVVTNTNSISIELCDTQRDGKVQAGEATLANAAALCRELMARYGIPAENVYRHFDVTGKLCPAYMVEDAAWRRFKARLEEHMDNKPAAYAEEAVKWAMENGILQGDGGDLKLSAPCTRQQMVVFLHRFLRYLREKE